MQISEIFCAGSRNTFRCRSLAVSEVFFVGGFVLHSLKLTAKAPENGWLEYFLVSFWDGLFSGAFAVSFRECKLLIVDDGKLMVQDERMKIDG